MPIREKPSALPTRIKDAALRIPRSAKDAAKNVNRSAEDIQERRYETGEQYAESKIEEGGRDLAKRGTAAVQEGAKVGVKRGQDAFVRSIRQSARRIRSSRPASAQKSSPGATQTPPIRTTSTSHTPSHSPQRSPNGGRFRSNASQPRPQVVRQMHIRFRTGYARRASPKSHSIVTSPQSPLSQATQHAQQIQQTAYARRNAQRIQRSIQTVQGNPHPGKSTTPSMPRGRTSSRSVKSVRRSVKSGKRTVKTAKRTVKTAQRTARTAAKAAQRAKQAAHAAKQLAIQTAKAMQAAAKLTIKLITYALKALLALVKAIGAAIAAGGWVAVVVVIVIMALVAVLVSAFGIFFTDEVEDNPPISEVIAIVETDMRVKVQEVIDGAGADRVIIDQDGDGGLIQNWRDILAVYAVKMTTNPEDGMAVIMITDEHIEKIKGITLDMNRISYHVESETTTKTTVNSDGTTTESSVTEKVLYVSVVGKDARTQAQEYGFTIQQMALLEELLSPDYRALFTAMLGHEAIIRPTSEALEIIYHNLPEGELGSEIVKLALTRLGDEYDYGHGAGGGPGSKVDCSAFTQWVYGQFGISIPRTAAAQGKYCVDNGLTIAYGDLVPGDLIFFSHDTNGRFMDITHVAIYAGDGMVVDSSSSKGEVVYRKLYSGAVLYGRPHITTP